MGAIRLSTLFAIRVYQTFISFDHGLLKVFYPNGYCRFHPTCSQYGYEAIERFGVIKGLYIASKRLIRCHPWSDGGTDEIPGK